MIPIGGRTACRASLHRTRGGFGTTTTFVLVTTGIALMILIFANLQSSGTRISIERAYTTGHLLRVGKMALDEAFTSKKGQEAFSKAMLKCLTDAAAAAPAAGLPSAANSVDDRDRLLRAFLGVILVPSVARQGQVADKSELWAALPPPSPQGLRPVVLDPLAVAPPGQPPPTPVPVPGAYWWEQNGQVVFSEDSRYVASYQPEILDLAYADEVKAGTLKVDPVEMRVVIFRADATAGASGPVGKGIVRGRVKARWVLAREYEGRAMAIARTLMEDRVFSLRAPPPVFDPTTGQRLPQTREWQFDMVTEWQREALDE